MPASFRILSDRGLVYVRYHGRATAQDGLDAFRAYMAHPDCRPGLKQLVDLSAVTDIEQDFPRLLQLQAVKAEQFVTEGPQTLIVYFAPGAMPQRMAMQIIRSWDGIDHVVPRVLTDEAECLSVLGLAETRLADLLAETG
jgi:hypothetical protein